MREVQALQNGGIYDTIYIKVRAKGRAVDGIREARLDFLRLKKGKSCQNFYQKCYIIFDILYAVPAIDFSGKNDKINNGSRKRGQPPGAASVKYVFDTRRE